MTNLNTLLLYPLCAMFALSGLVLLKMLSVRIRSVKTGKIPVSYFKLYPAGGEPEDVIKTTRHFANLFEAPVLFYVVCILGMILPMQGLLFLTLAWLYVATRVVQAIIHLGPNSIRPRMGVYALGWLILTCMWVDVLVTQLMLSAAVAAVPI